MARTMTDVAKQGILSGDDYNHWLERAAAILLASPGRVQARTALACELRDAAKQNAPLYSDIGWYADTVGYVLDHVNWIEIADMLLEV